MIKKFLQPFYRAILEIQEDYAITDNIFFIMDIIIQYFEVALISKFLLKLDKINIVR
jgi:hypothetical protein